MPPKTTRSVNVVLALAVVLLFACQARATSFSTIYTFPLPPTNGMTPNGNLLYVDGALVGVTRAGGSGTCTVYVSGCGVVYALTPGSGRAWNFRLLYQFSSGTDAQNPVGNLVRDAAGNVYGAAQYGGSNGFGAVYKLSLSGGRVTESVIYSFTNMPDGANPGAGLSMDAAGNIWGTTGAGGTGNYGTVFRLTPNSDGTWTGSVIHSFTDAPDGFNPQGEVIFDASGNVYGTTQAGGNNGTYGDGVVYQLNPGVGGEWTESILYTFPNVSMGYPVHALLMDSAGNLFGVGKSDGEQGSVYEISPILGGWSETTIYEFLRGSHTGFEPDGNLVLGPQGQLVGTVRDGTPQAGGAIFELVQGSSGWTYVILHEFSNAQGGTLPNSGLTQGRPGFYYGTTAVGNNSAYGTVYQITP